MKGDDQEETALNSADQVYLPIFVIAELEVGFKRGSKLGWNREVLSKFEAKPTVERLFPTTETIDIFSDLFNELRVSGTPIPTHNIWIAALAIETGASIVTYGKHFHSIRQARIWNI